jgi:hypothetical protein
MVTLFALRVFATPNDGCLNVLATVIDYSPSENLTCVFFGFLACSGPLAFLLTLFDLLVFELVSFSADVPAADDSLLALSLGN